MLSSIKWNLVGVGGVNSISPCLNNSILTMSSINIMKVSYQEQMTRNILNADCISACLTAASCARGAALGGRGGSLCRRCLNRQSLALALGLLRRGVPVVHHLQCKNSVQSKTGNESVENQLVINLLESSEDARKRSGEVVEDLQC